MGELRSGPRPGGLHTFPKEIVRASRRWAEKSYRNLVYWNRLDRGGHFAAFEQPELFAKELRACLRKMHVDSMTRKRP